jgi:transcription initiation factor IIE alpha subunit
MSRLPEHYPDLPGWKAAGPSEDAAARVAGAAAVMRARVLQVFKNHYPQGLTADEVASHLNLSILSVRPRCSELRRAGNIVDSQARRRNESGMSATVWRFFPQNQSSGA